MSLGALSGKVDRGSHGLSGAMRGTRISFCGGTLVARRNFEFNEFHGAQGVLS